MAARVAGPEHASTTRSTPRCCSRYLANRMEDRVGILSFATDGDAGPRPGRGSAAPAALSPSSRPGRRRSYVHTDYLALAAELRRRAPPPDARRHLHGPAASWTTRPLLRAVRTLSPPHLPLLVVLDRPGPATPRRALPARGQGGAVRGRWWPATCRSAREQTVRELRRLGALVVESDARRRRARGDERLHRRQAAAAPVRGGWTSSASSASGGRAGSGSSACCATSRAARPGAGRGAPPGAGAPLSPGRAPT